MSEQNFFFLAFVQNKNECFREKLGFEINTRFRRFQNTFLALFATFVRSNKMEKTNYEKMTLTLKTDKSVRSQGSK